MEDVISLSSDDSDVEIVGFYNEVLTKLEPLPPLSAVRIDVDAVTANIPPHCIDLTDPRWAPPQLNKHKRQDASVEAVVDLTEGDSSWPDQETENLPPDDCQQENSPVNQTSNEKDCTILEDFSVFPPQQDCGKQKPKEKCFNSQTQHQKQSFVGYPYHTPSVKLTRLPLLETHVTKVKTSRCSVHLTKDNTDIPLRSQRQDSKHKAAERRSTLRTSTPPTVPHTEPSFDESPPLIGLAPENSEEIASTRLQDQESQHLQSPADSPSSNKASSVAASGEHDTHEEERDDFSPSVPVPSPPCISSPLDKGQIEALCSDMEEMEVLMTDDRQSYHSDHSSHHSPTAELNHCKSFDPDPLSHTSPSSPSLTGRGDSPPPFDHTSAEDMPEWQLETEEYRDDLGVASPLSFLWQEGSDKEDGESRSGSTLEAVSREDRHFVCPVAFRKIMSETPQVAIDDNNEGFGTPEILCRQSLSLVYTTIEENLSEGTLQLLSDLLQPGFYPPRDITAHLLRGIMLDPVCPNHICGKAFNLLMRAQRHHMVDETTIPWDWELLTAVMEHQDHSKRYRYEVVRMLLEYIVQTLEDDYRAKRSSSSLHSSIAKATLSCDQQFPRVRDVINWMFSAIKKSECGESKETTGEKDEHIRIVSIFQRMLSLALEVDHSPALNSTKLAQELFHMLISGVPLRAHRMLLLRSLQSELLRCKLLAHLLDFACPVKIPMPMSLSLLLHFLKNCILAPDPTDGTKRWQRWEELVHLLWMLLFSYNKAMKGYLYSSLTEQRNRTGMSVYKPDDMLTKSAVCEAVEAFLHRSQDDLGEALPLHVEESLTYLQDHLLDICQC